MESPNFGKFGYIRQTKSNKALLAIHYSSARKQAAFASFSQNLVSELTLPVFLHQTYILFSLLLDFGKLKPDSTVAQLSKACP